MSARVLINVPKIIRAHEAFLVKVLISHPMESGQRRDPMGVVIPRDIISRFVCSLDGEMVLDVDLYPAISANPFLSFSVVAAKAGTLTMVFTGDHGLSRTESVAFAVT